jgi:hypothetical protein
MLVLEPGLSMMKHMKAKPMTSAEKLCMLNVFKKVREDNPHMWSGNKVLGLV